VKIVRFSAADRTAYGILAGETVRALAGSPYGRLRTVVREYPLGDVRLLAPCRPTKIVALGVNYRSHGEEMGSRLPAEPLLFIKPATAVVGPEDGIVYPEMSARVDYEGELAVVVGRRARNVTEAEAGKYILGYTCCNDVTARDLQARDKQWTRAKGFDTFAPLGPCIETELDPYHLRLETRLNGEVKQSTSTGDLVFGVYELVSFISRVMTLLPGDVIATGTPGGIGPMQPGDTVEVEIEGIGRLRNKVVRPERGLT
jgi:2-keto-4-pentenoate hydratase/2-oxohepta-3-ene-1,7-dioic acid hydratase in catechol pathway